MMNQEEKENGRNRKRKACQDFLIQNTNLDHQDDQEDALLRLDLCLGLTPSIKPRRTPTPPQIQQQNHQLSPQLRQQPPPISPQQQHFTRLQQYSFLSDLPSPITEHPLQLSPSHSIYNNNINPSLNHHPQAKPVVHPPPGPPRQRARRNPTQAPREGKSDTVPEPFPWATNHRATVHSLDYLLSRQIFKISGEVQCKRCERQYEIEFDLQKKFGEVGSYIVANKQVMHERAPSVWMNPVLPTCKFCEQENSVKPIISDKKKSINWLFLLLGEMLGCCTLEQLKYFCKHTKNHRTGAKDRVLFLTYLGLCKQLAPQGPFERI